MRSIVLALAAAALVTAAPALAAKNPEQAHLEKTLRTSMAKALAQEGAGLKLTTVTCRLPKNGVTAHCTARFAAGHLKGYYPVKATIEESGKLAWTASSPRCTNAKGKRVSCSPKKAAGTISVANAQALFRRGGFPYQGKQVAVARARCAGIAAKPHSKKGFSELTCTLTGRDRHVYRVHVVMVGPTSVSLASVSRVK